MQKNSKKIMLTGGHAATSALAVIEKVQEKHPNWNISWIGSSEAFINKKAKTLDFQLFPELGVKCYAIQTGKLQRKISISSVMNLLKVPVGCIQALGILFKEKPEVILSFGGYAALPVVWVGKLLGYPVLIHEQTLGFGLANKLSLPFADDVLLSREESSKYFRNKKSHFVGLPLHNATQKIALSKKKNPDTILILGGSRGSQTINLAVKEVLPTLLKKYEIIHLCGSLDEDNLKSHKRILSSKIRDKYEVIAHVPPLEMANKYAQADIVIARAGAHTVAEVMALGKAAIFIPIPWVQRNEQLENARLAEKYSGARIIEESKLNSETLLQEINHFEQSWKELTLGTDNKLSKKDRGAALQIVKILEKYVQ